MRPRCIGASSSASGASSAAPSPSPPAVSARGCAAALGVRDRVPRVLGAAPRPPPPRRSLRRVRLVEPRARFVDDHLRRRVECGLDEALALRLVNAVQVREVGDHVAQDVGLAVDDLEVGQVVRGHEALGARDRGAAAVNEQARLGVLEH